MRRLPTFHKKREKFAWADDTVGAAGVSNPHPHGQIYATNFVFKTIETEVRASQRH
jgi:galactose-1-phosphate uridylyltransferase